PSPGADGKRVVKAIYPVAVGKASTPSPTGTFTIVKHVINPTYYHQGKMIPPGPENPVGNRWMELSAAGYGIHGTNAHGSIEKAVSHGCFRYEIQKELPTDLRSRDEVGRTLMDEPGCNDAGRIGRPTDSKACSCWPAY